MIFKFIDNNGSEITVNSLSSLQGLLDSETIKKNTKVKAGLRGKWTTADNIEGLVFTKEISKEEPEEDIKSFITADEKEKKIVAEDEKLKKDVPTKKQKKIITQLEQPKQKDKITKSTEVQSKITKTTEVQSEIVEEVIEDQKLSEEKSEYELEEEKRDKSYDDENIIGLNFFEAISICFKKYFNFKDRASRSEYWYFQLVYLPIAAWTYFPTENIIILLIQLILACGFIIPLISSCVRRLHDTDNRGWWFLISIIPLIGAIILLIMLIKKGTEGQNRFGKYPLKLK